MASEFPPDNTVEIAGQPVGIEDVTVKQLLLEILRILREFRALKEIEINGRD